MKHLFFGALLLTFACARGGDNAATTSSDLAPASEVSATETGAAQSTSSAPATDTTASAPQEQASMSSYENKVAELHTSAGEIDIRFFPDVAPNHVKNFIDLANKGFYNGTKFHRVIPGFMIQGGDPNTVSGDPNSWGVGGSGSNVKAEFNTISHKRGIVSMARAQHPDSASSQFFIVVADSPFLDRQYTVFGQVTKGMEIADKIVSAPRGPNDRPNNPTTIDRVVIRDAREDEKGPTPK